jgi:hypothetical protein
VPVQAEPLFERGRADKVGADIEFERNAGEAGTINREVIFLVNFFLFRSKFGSRTDAQNGGAF